MTIIIIGPRGRALASRSGLHDEAEALQVAEELSATSYALDQHPASVELRDGGKKLWRISIHKFIERFILPRIQDQRDAAREVAHAVV